MTVAVTADIITKLYSTVRNLCLLGGLAAMVTRLQPTRSKVVRLVLFASLVDGKIHVIGGRQDGGTITD